MTLILKIVSFKNQPVTEEKSVMIGSEGGSIGRSEDNDLVLVDAEKFVSRHHASISYENGCYFLSDSSLGGVFINGHQTPLNNSTQQIVTDSILKIGEYEISVLVVVDEFCNDDFLFPNVSSPFKSLPITAVNLFNDDESSSNSLMTGLFSETEDLIVSESVVFKSALEYKQSPLSDSYIAPNLSQSLSPVFEEIPENISFDDFFSPSVPSESKNSLPIKPVDVLVDNPDYYFDDLLGAALSEIEIINPVDGLLNQDISVSNSHDLVSESTPSPELIIVVQQESNHSDIPVKHEEVPLSKLSEKSSQALFDGVLLTELMRGAGINPITIAPDQQKETVNRIGQVFRKLIDGTVAVLRSRAEFKSLCRVNMTVISATNNNPLKFTVSTDDVLRQLMENNTEGFLSSTSAIEESFTDIMNHQLAMQAGIQASLTDLLKRFDPKYIEKHFEQGIVLQKKAKCWDRFSDIYQTILEDAVEDFYGDAFVKAYEQQIKQLAHSRKK